MSQEQKPVVSAERVGALAQALRTVRLVWRLLCDSRVPLFPKLIILVGAIYIISPVDLVPDVILGLGQLDDLGIAMLAISLFVEMCPRAIVDEHRRAIAAEAGKSARPPEGDIIEGTSRVVSDDDSTDK